MGRDRQVSRRLTRVLRILLLLLDGPLSRAELAARFEVSERQISSDLALLRAAGVTLRRTRAGYLAQLPTPPAND